VRPSSNNHIMPTEDIPVENAIIHDVKPFSNFVKMNRPFPFDDHRSLLFVKMCSNASFKVGDEVFYVLSGILIERSSYFKELFLGLPMTVDSQIPIYGIDAVLFKSIIEWIYTFEVRGLDVPSPTLLDDLERVYIAARMYNIVDLCDSIESYLKYFVNERNFGEIHQIAIRIESKSLLRVISRAWISKSDEFNKNDDQIVLALMSEPQRQLDFSTETRVNVQESARINLAGMRFSYLLLVPPTVVREVINLVSDDEEMIKPAKETAVVVKKTKFVPNKV
jgi:hypothetical protein